MRSGDEQILKNIKKGATIDMAKRFTENCHKLGLIDPRRFHRRLPGETRETIRNTIEFAKKLDVRDHPGFHRPRLSRAPSSTITPRRTTWSASTCRTMQGHQLPNVIYPGILDRAEMVEWVERFYGEYYFRPKAAWRIVRKALFDNQRPQAPLQGSQELPEPARQAPEVRRRIQGRGVVRHQSGVSRG